jgi:hypothetical protein
MRVKVSVTPTAPNEPIPADEKLTWEAVVSEQPDDEEDASPRRPSSLLFFTGMAVLGIALAFGWRHSGADQWTFGPWPADAAQSASGASAPSPESKLARTLRELDGLRKSVGELAAANRQMATTIAALQTTQTELRGRISALQLGSLWPDPGTMKYRLVVQDKSSASAPASRSVTARAEPRRITKPRENAPLQLLAPRP